MWRFYAQLYDFLEQLDRTIKIFAKLLNSDAKYAHKFANYQIKKASTHVPAFKTETFQ